MHEPRITHAEPSRSRPPVAWRSSDAPVPYPDAIAAMEARVAAIRAGTFTGIGLNQRGAHPGRFIHLDILSPAVAPRPRVWTYG